MLGRCATVLCVRRRHFVVAALCVALVLPASADASVPQVKRAIRTVFGAHASVALCIADRENSYSQTAVGAAGEVSTFQIHPVWFGTRWYLRRAERPRFVRVSRATLIASPRYAAAVAYEISRAGTDWSPWTVHAACGV